jgi:hypothetical protein
VSGPETDLRAAVEAVLALDAGVTGLLGDPPRLSDTRDPRAAYPNASWGRAETLERGADGVSIAEHRLSLEIWCRNGDPAPIVAAIRAALFEADIDLPAPWTLISLMPAYCDVFTTRDLRVKRGLVRLKAVMGRVLDQA